MFNLDAVAEGVEGDTVELVLLDKGPDKAKPKDKVPMWRKMLINRNHLYSLKRFGVDSIPDDQPW
jgi:hypothetical protein